MARDFKKRALKFAVLPAGKPIFAEETTYIEIVDEAGGEFIEITQSGSDGRIRFDDDEWELIRTAINDAFADIKKNAKVAS